jgi:Domain of unknown function (DUF397)
MNTRQPVVVTRSWRKSSYCDTGGQCVEVAHAGTTHLVRDSANPNGGCLVISAPAWAAFIRDVKDGAHRA